MRKIAIAAALMLSLPALANGPAFRAKLTGYQEVPAVNTVAEGDFEGRFGRDGIEYTMTYSGLQAPVLMSHIHFAQPSVNGSIVVWLCGTASNPGPAGTQVCPGTGGTISGTISPANVIAAATTSQQFPAGAFDALVDAMLAGAAYVNIHSTASPGGEIRGQVFGAGHFAR